jgi:hypothetical protein
VVAQKFPNFEMPTNDRESPSFNPTLHHNIQKAVNSFFTRNCNPQELKDIHKSNTRKKLIPVRLVPEFSNWFEETVIKRMVIFLKNYSSDPDVQQILSSNVIKIPSNLVTSFVSLFRRLEEEDNPPVDIYQLKPKRNIAEKISPEQLQIQANRKSSLGKRPKNSYPAKVANVSVDEEELVDWADLVQNHFRNFDFPVTAKERSMYHPSIHQRISKMVRSFLSRECNREELKEALSEKCQMIPTRLSPLFLRKFKSEVIDRQIVPTHDMPWKEVLKEYYPIYEPPTHQLSASYIEMLDGIEQFLQAECTPEELAAQSANSRRKKIPARLIPEFVTWFRSEYRMTDESSDEESDDQEDNDDESGKSWFFF